MSRNDKRKKDQKCRLYLVPGQSRIGRNNLLAVWFFCMLLTNGCSSGSKGLQSLAEEVKDLRMLQVSRSLEIDGLRSDVRELRGRIEELEHQRSGEVRSIKDALSTLQKRVPPPAGVPKAALSKALASADALPSVVSADVTVALSAIRDGDFQQAITVLEVVLEESRGERYVPEVLFWLAVAYDGVDQNRPALRAYHEIITEYPTSALVPSAMWRQAQVLERMSDPDAARKVWAELIKRHPNSPEADSARKFLSDNIAEYR